MTLTVDDRQRYIIAKYFRDRRPRATREMVRLFASGAFGTAMRVQLHGLPGRQRRVAEQLPKTVDAELLREPVETQLVLFT